MTAAGGQTMLQRKMAALGYQEVFHPDSAPLVQQLLDDVIHTTESFRRLRQHSTAVEQEAGGFHSKASTTYLA